MTFFSSGGGPVSLQFSKEKQVGKKKLKEKSSQQKRKYWKDKCLTLWSKIVRERVGYTCEYCGAKPKRTEAHHIIARGTTVSPGWFDLRNGLSLCTSHHKWHGFHSNDFETQQKMNQWVRGHLEKKGIDYETQRIIWKAPGKMSLLDLELMYKSLQEEYKKIQGDAE